MTGQAELKMITVAGVTFSADEVVSAVVKKDGREIFIQAVAKDEKKIGFTS